MENSWRSKQRRCRLWVTVAGLAAIAAVAVIVFVVVRWLMGPSSSPSQDMTTLPHNLLVGAASSAYQIEGAWNEDGKGENIWDRFTHINSSEIADGQTGDVACDSYHNYKEDVMMVKETGFDVYRFSISWSRVLPKGYGDVTNQAGLDYYHRLIDELLAAGIQPMVTLYHWDLPQPIQEQGGWTNSTIIDCYVNYADIMFQQYGNEVKWWFTINEPYQVAKGYNRKDHAPGQVDPGISDYLVIHNLLRAHAKTYRLYDSKYRPSQKGKVAMTIFASFAMPVDPESKEDQDAAERSIQFELGLFAHPIFSPDGDYPPEVRQRVDSNSQNEGRNGSRLPSFTAQEIEDLKGSSDFFGVNHYVTRWVSSGLPEPNPSIPRDSGVIVNRTAIYSKGLRGLLNWIKSAYNNPTVFIGENGCHSDMGLNDTDRVQFYHDFIEAMLEAVYEDGCTVIGYNMWSIMDVFEWQYGYTRKYGLWNVDFNNSTRPRQMKLSAHYVKRMMDTRRLPSSNFTY